MDIVKYTEFLVSSLVDDPEMVKVEMFDEDENTKIIEVMVPENEMKYVIGKSGKNAHALRTLINAFAYIHKMNRVKINISAF
jgi:predicted RNA-binding protein YlqC (UPF0109 family)